MKLTEPQKRMLREIYQRGKIRAPEAAQGPQGRTAHYLRKNGLVERFVPGAESWADAARGRVAYLCLTVEGLKEIENLQKEEPK